MFAFAGLWDCWTTPEENSVESCSIITTMPNALVADVHNRMPVNLQPDDYDLWLDPSLNNVQQLTSLLVPYEAKLMRRYAVSTRGNSVIKDDAGCSEPVDVPAAWG